MAKVITPERLQAAVEKAQKAGEKQSQKLNNKLGKISELQQDLSEVLSNSTLTDSKKLKRVAAINAKISKYVPIATSTYHSDFDEGVN